MRETTLNSALQEYIKKQASLKNSADNTHPYLTNAVFDSSSNIGIAKKQQYQAKNTTIINPKDGKAYKLSTRTPGLIFGNPTENNSTPPHPFATIRAKPTSRQKSESAIFYIDTGNQTNDPNAKFLQYSAAPVNNPSHMHTLITFWRHANYDLPDNLQDNSTKYLVLADELKIALAETYGERCANAILAQAKYESGNPNPKNTIIAIETYHLTLAAYLEAMIQSALEKKYLAKSADEHTKSLSNHISKLQTHGEQITPNDIYIRLKNPEKFLTGDKTLLDFEADIEKISVANSTTVAHVLLRSNNPLANTPLSNEINLAEACQHHCLTQETGAIICAISEKEDIFKNEDPEFFNPQKSAELHERNLAKKQEIAKAQQEQKKLKHNVIVDIQTAITKRMQDKDNNCCSGNSSFFKSNTQFKKFATEFHNLNDKNNPQPAIQFFAENINIFSDASAKSFERQGLLVIDSNGRQLTQKVVDALKAEPTMQPTLT